jgi:hypothetical protein
MPLQKLQFRPGINREGTTLANEGGWFQGNMIRFRSGQVEKMGGWTLDSGQVSTGGNYVGVARSMLMWNGITGYNYLGLGTNQKFYVQQGQNGNLYDVTPFRAVISSPSASFAATNGSTTVTVTQSGNGVQTGDYVIFSGAVSLGGNVTAAILNRGQGFVVTYINSTQYSIQVPTAANASDTGNGGGSVKASYQIPGGNAYNTTANGWGAGGWGGSIAGTASTTLNGAITNSATTITVASTASFPTLTGGAIGTLLIDTELITYTGQTGTTFTGCTRGTNGTIATAHSNGATVTNAASFIGWGLAAPTGFGVTQSLRLWSQANFGQNLIFNYRGGPLYYWVVDSNPNIYNVAQVLSKTNSNTQNGTAYWLTDASCPTIANFVMVSDASRFVIAFGTDTYGDGIQNPMLISWSDQESPVIWAPTTTNQAGNFTLSRGSQIISAKQNRQEIVVWTDSALYSMQYLGAPYVWGFNLMMDNISIIGPNTTALASNIMYWMGYDKFYMYSGGVVQTLPCTLREYVYQNINLTQTGQFFAGTNEGFNEVWWFYCSQNSQYIDSYVIYNYLEQIWYYGSMTRTAWYDSPLRTYPMSAGWYPLSQTIGGTYTPTTVNPGLLYQENGVNDGTTNPPSPIASYVQSSDFDIGDGSNFGFVWRIIPDVSFNGSVSGNPSVNFTVLPRQNPGATYGTSDNPAVTSTLPYTSSVNTYNIQQFTQYAYCRIRGRQMALMVSSNQAGTQWQLGNPRLEVRPDGRR